MEMCHCPFFVLTEAFQRALRFDRNGKKVDQCLWTNFKVRIDANPYPKLCSWAFGETPQSDSPCHLDEGAYGDTFTLEQFLNRRDGNFYRVCLMVCGTIAFRFGELRKDTDTSVCPCWLLERLYPGHRHPRVL
jgi:hypothetical protein